MRARIRKAMEEKDQGFTLIELLVVMIIIGILAAIAIPVFLNQRQKAVDSSIKSDLRTVANSVETFSVDSQAYPTSAQFTASTGAPSGNQVTVGTTPIAVSSGNTVTYIVQSAANGGGYCLGGWNAKATANATSLQYWYVSTKGGLQSTPSGTPSVCT